jgi:hypothetical protein
LVINHVAKESCEIIIAKLAINILQNDFEEYMGCICRVTILSKQKR